MSKEKPKPQRVVAPPLIIDSNQIYSMDETSALKRQCRAQTYKDIAAKRLATFKKGRRRYCTGAEIIRSNAAEACAS